MSKFCNGKGCFSAWDCDNCHNSGECVKSVECDICGEECDENYYDINGNDYCRDCMENLFQRSVY